MLPNRILCGTRREYTIEHLVDASDIATTTPDERKLLRFVLPPWQRPEVWSQAQQVRFIESIFLGLGPGYYVVNRPEWDYGGHVLPMSGWLLDGQQRLCAIRDFIDEKFSVFGDIRLSSLSIGEARRRFWNENFPCFELEYCDSEAELKTLYARLNFGGTAHTAEDLARLG